MPKDNFIYFISHTNPFNLELLQKYGLLTEEIWEFLEENSRDLMIYSDPGVLELLLKKGIINFENLPVLFKDEVIEPAILQEGKPENFAALIQAGLINPDNFGQLVRKPGFYHLVQIPPENLRQFLKKNLRLERISKYIKYIRRPQKKPNLVTTLTTLK